MSKALLNSSIALVLCVLFVWVAYEAIDKPVALWAYANQLKQFHGFDLFVHVPEVIMGFLFLMYPILAIRFCLTKPTYLDRAILAAANSSAIGYFLVTPLKVIFGRYNPKAYMGHFPRLLNQHLYGFNFFHVGSAFASFPSGHTTVAVAALTTLAITYPLWRWFAMLMSALIMIGLVVTNYHFVGDVIGGAFLGGVTGYFTTLFMGFIPRKEESPPNSVGLHSSTQPTAKN